MLTYVLMELLGNSLSLPDLDHLNYLIPYRYTRWVSSKKLKIVGECKVFNETFHLDHLFVVQYGSKIEEDWKKQSLRHRVVDAEFVREYPELKPSL